MKANWLGRTAVAVALLTLATVPPASAGPYGDSLGKCLVESTTSADKTALVRWMFAMMALHPDVQSSSSVNAEQRTAMSKQMAQLTERLVTADCVQQTREAIRYEGASTIEAAFRLLGQVAARELFTHPKVAEGLAEIANFFDAKKLKELGSPAEPASPPKSE